MTMMTTEMKHQDWFVDGQGQCQPRPAVRPWDLLQEQYYLHQFLSDILSILANAPDELDQWDYLPHIRRKVRQLVLISYWLKTQRAEPDPKTGVALVTLYDEIGYPLTVQNVTTRPGVVTPIHNHGTWGVVALLEGRERHTLWRRCGHPDFPDKLEQVGQKDLEAGEIISFMPDAIHQVETLGTAPALTFQIYGDTQPNSRYQFDPDTFTAKPF
jgi:predicted metal-dependent enzyme (double-stranded beta helix superfamily)